MKHIDIINHLRRGVTLEFTPLEFETYGDEYGCDEYGYIRIYSVGV